MQTSLGLFHIIIYHLRLRLKDVYCGIDSKTIVHIGYSMMNKFDYFILSCEGQSETIYMYIVLTEWYDT